MANRQRGEIGLKLGGTSYTLKLTTNALCLMEGSFQPLRPFAVIVAGVSRGSFSDLRAFLWAAMQAHHPTLTLEAVGDLIDLSGGIEGIAQKLTDLVDANKEAGTVPPREAQTTGTGDGSTLTPEAPSV
ncbi:MAG TPA: hypothetical protein VNM37_02340 [Candidatus Dormibacteraeota bacterium]|nr:hypothetical protein [Candidatus Dormibacteraeota bacterium]